jgi:mono/diheme cytochrome c family protein
VLLTVTTTGKVTLLIVAGAFVAWALITAIWIPKRNPDFPVTLTAFLLVSSVFFVAQLGAVYWVTATQEVETEAVETTPAETTPAETTPETTTEETSTEETSTEETTTEETSTEETTTTETTPAGGDAAAGKEVFASNPCGSCHTLADAGASGTVGPNLDEAKPSAGLVVDRVTNGKGVMPSFKDSLTEQQIQDIAAYVSSVAGT